MMSPSKNRGDIFQGGALLQGGGSPSARRLQGLRRFPRMLSLSRLQGSRRFPQMLSLSRYVGRTMCLIGLTRDPIIQRFVVAASAVVERIL